MKKPLLYNPAFIVLPYFLLMSIGALEVWSSSYYFAYRFHHNPNFFFFWQLKYVVVSLVVAVFFSFLNYRFLDKLTVLLVVFSLFLLVLLHFKGVNIRGATRWLNIAGHRFEPSFVAEFSLLVYMAHFISKRINRGEELSESLYPFALVVGIFFVLIVTEPDVGSAVLVALVFMGVIYVYGFRFKSIILLGLPIAVIVALIIYSHPEKLQRIINFFITKKVNYQIHQALVALGSGGVFGQGVAKGVYKTIFVPDSYNDFILAGIGEDFGFVGVAFVLLLLLSIIWFGFEVSKRCRDLFGSVLALGITLFISIEALMNIFSVLHLIPPKGITLPFVSYGGTSLIVHGAYVGILLSIYSRCGGGKKGKLSV
ncbi:FtsW/RodA/SpoVE family cell cycle protein [Hippea jasoniae]|uniref:FtsW/RodA/SpoVE family cell cycle protein n=1 Tax=Hippea jasoniae TaxID=944479 RepID=UPI00054DA87B|nr:FtsW/RodA/SpoVE family cell cycle protein [Hippea jasoniae]